MDDGNATVQKRNIEVVSSSSGQYKVKVGRRTWLHGGSTFIHAYGKKWTTDDNSLRLVKVTKSFSGVDVLGK